MAPIIFPSIIAKNQQELDAQLKRLTGAAKTLHLDIVDGKFAPNRSLDFPFKLSHQYKYQAHLMIRNPEQWIQKHGHKVDLCILQAEETDLCCYVPWMKREKKKVAFALKPETPVTVVKPYLQDIDYILLLTVHPGFYGAPFLSAPLKKVREIKKLNPKIKVIVDGGMNPQMIKEAKKAGADLFVSGSYIMKNHSPKKAIEELMRVIR